MLLTKNLATLNEGSAVPSLTTHSLNRLKIELPPLQTQKQIAHVLSTIDKKIELNQRILLNLEQQLDTLYKNCRSKAVRTLTFSQLCEISSSKRVFAKDYKPAGIPFYRGKEITLKSKGQNIENKLYISKEHFEKIRLNSGIPLSGDILLTAVGTIGNIYMVGNEEFYFKDGNIIWLNNFKSPITNHYIYGFMRTNEFKHLVESITIGTTQKALTIKSLNKLTINLPENKELDRYHNTSKSIYKSHASIKDKNLKLTALRDTLLPKLMSGEIDVSQVKL